MIKSNFCLLFILFFSVSLQAKTTIIDKKITTYIPSDCEARGICSLVEFSLIDEKKEVTTNGGFAPNYMSDVRMVLKTKKVAELNDYAIVQYIKGCQYTSEWDGKNEKQLLDISRNYFDQIVVFKHEKWSIDSDNMDPVYTAWKGNRFALFRWNKDPKSYNPEGATYMAQKAPPHPVVFATDLPGTSSVNKDEFSGFLKAKNSSLEFKTCLFKNADLPAVSTPDGEGIDLSKAIVCHGWESKFRYDFKQKKMIRGGSLVPLCMEEK